MGRESSETAASAAATGQVFVWDVPGALRPGLCAEQAARKASSVVRELQPIEQAAPHREASDEWYSQALGDQIADANG